MLAIDPQLKVQVVPGGVAAGAHFGDLLALGHLVPGLDTQRIAVVVAGLHLVWVCDLDIVPLLLVVSRLGDGAIHHRQNGGVLGRGNIHSRVDLSLAGDGVFPRPIGRGDDPLQREHLPIDHRVSGVLDQRAL